jgi:hypothetical protein
MTLVVLSAEAPHDIHNPSRLAWIRNDHVYFQTNVLWISFEGAKKINKYLKKQTHVKFPLTLSRFLNFFPLTLVFLRAGLEQLYFTYAIYYAFLTSLPMKRCTNYRKIKELKWKATMVTIFMFTKTHICYLNYYII